MKKDPKTGHYVGVATWVSNNQPIPGTMVYQKASIENNKIKTHSEVTPEVQDTEKHTQIEDSRSEFNRHVEKFKAERTPARGGFFDPYDSYDM